MQPSENGAPGVSIHMNINSNSVYAGWQMS